MEMSDDRWQARRLATFDYSSADHPYFLTLRAAPGISPFGDPSLAQAVIDGIHWLRTERKVTVYAYTVMPDHLHLLVQLGTDQWSISSLVKSLKRHVTRHHWNQETDGPLWQDRFYDHVVRRAEDGRSIAHYILLNPVRRGLVQDVEEYPFSGTPDPLE